MKQTPDGHQRDHERDDEYTSFVKKQIHHLFLGTNQDVDSSAAIESKTRILVLSYGATQHHLKSVLRDIESIGVVDVLSDQEGIPSKRNPLYEYSAFVIVDSQTGSLNPEDHSRLQDLCVWLAERPQDRNRCCIAAPDEKWERYRVPKILWDCQFVSMALLGDFLSNFHSKDNELKADKTGPYKKKRNKE